MAFRTAAAGKPVKEKVDFKAAIAKRIYPLRYQVIETREQFVWMLAQLNKYLAQRIINADGTEQKPILACDLETYLGYEPPVSTKRKKGKGNDDRPFPRPIWDGKKWLGRIRYLSIGLDAFEDQWRLRDKQFLVDVKALGEELVTAGLKEILENTPLIMHNAKYDLGFMLAQLDISPKFLIDTMLMAQTYWSGDHIVRYKLHFQYGQFLHNSEMEALTGMTHAEYAGYKEEQQESDWGVDECSLEQDVYAADDVRVIWFLYYRMLEALDEWCDTYERKFREDKGIFSVVKLERKLIRTYTMMELRGVPYDKKRHLEDVVPFLEKKREEMRDLLAARPEFIVKHTDGKKVITIKKKPEYAWEFVKGEAAGMSSQFRKLLKEAYGLDDIEISPEEERIFKATKFSVNVDHPADGDVVYVEWYGKTRKGVVKAFLEDHIHETWHILPKQMININSPDQLNEALSKALGFQIESTQAKHLKQYAADDEILIRDIIDYKNAADACRKFGRPLADFCTDAGYIHCNWNQMGSDDKGVRSGRNSSSKPNLQQIPARHTLFKRGVKGEPGYFPGVSALHLFRDTFVADPGFVFIDADLSQIEPRLTAEFTGDERLIKALCNNEDLHGLTAMAVLDLDYAPSKIEVDGEEKLVRVYKDGTIGEASEEDKFYRDYIGKTMNLAIGYGIGGPALAQFMFENTDGRVIWDKKQANEMIDRYFTLYPAVREKMDEYRDIIGRRLYKAGSLAAFKGRKPFAVVFSELGRPRRFCLSTDQERMDDYLLSRYYKPDGAQYYYNEFKSRISEASLAAYNHLIQSSACDLFKESVYQVDRRLRKLPGWDEWTSGIVACVHDEILVHAPKEYTEQIKKILKEEMEGAARKFLTKVPARVGISVAEKWGGCK